MVTGEKPDEQVDWGAVSALEHEAGAGLVRVGTAITETLDRIAVAVFMAPVRDLPPWLGELVFLETEHSAFGLRGAARRRLASLRKADARRVRLVRRRWQRRAIGLADV